MKKLRFLLISILIFNASILLWGQSHWESLVIESDQFRYLVPDSEPEINWNLLSFNDDIWQTGIGGFGYADGDDQTVTEDSVCSLYLRKVFTIPSRIPVKQLILDIDYDDAFVAYLNGTEVARSTNLSDGTPAFLGSVTVDHEAQMYSGGFPDRFLLDTAYLVDSVNILAVHIMNYKITSSDLSARIFLSAKLETEKTLFHSTPDWFVAPVTLDTNNLPIVKIDTEGQTIPDEPKITATMKVINNADGVNSFSDTIYEYDGYIGIEIRGNTAQMFPKKSYTVETRLSTGENNNVELLGMPAENDWVFHGPYSDKSLIRNALAYNIGNAMGKGWHPRTCFVELEINNEYRGVYLVVEKIKIDKNRVDIAKLRPEDISGDQLTGGYIISIDRDQEGSWNSPFMGRTGSVDVPFSYVDPKYDELTVEQRQYIRDYVTDFEYALDGSSYKDPQMGYRAYIDIISFIDYFIMTELSKDLDGYRVSVYFHKDKDSKDGKLTMTPFWDYNICFGNANFFSAGNPVGWAADGVGAGDWYEIPFWWDKFRTDPYFETLLKLRWEQLRSYVISKSRINAVIDSCSNLLAEAEVRNFTKFNILNTYIWPNNYIGGTYQNEIDSLKNWISHRIDWIDTQIASITPLQLNTPVLISMEPRSITRISAIVGGNVTDDGGSYIWERGIYWGQVPDPVQNGSKIKVGNGTGNFYSQLKDLRPDTVYYFIAYAKNDLGESYGTEYSFRTQKIGAPAVITNQPGEIKVHTAIVGGSVIDDGGAVVIERGVYIDTLPTPEMTGLNINAGSGTGNFSKVLSMLKENQVYYVKAYATNNSGTSFGELLSFSTEKDTIVNTESSFAKSGNFDVYPNPFTGNINFLINLKQNCNVKIVVTNLLGDIIINRYLDGHKGENLFIFNENDFSSDRSLYFYNIITDGIPLGSGKIVKL